MARLKQLFFKYKEYILYIFFGGLTTVVSWASFYICTHPLNIGTVISNIISWILAVAFAYVTNRKWVFESKTSGFRGIIREIIEFVAGRLLSLGIETVLLWITVDLCHWNNMLMKVIISVIVVVLNYIFSKLIAFRKK